MRVTVRVRVQARPGLGIGVEGDVGSNTEQSL